MEISLPFPSSSSFLKHYGSDTVRELCRSMVSKAVSQALFVFLVFQLGVVGCTIGAMVGAVIGWKNSTMSLVQDVILGAISGTTLSYKVIKATFDCFSYSDDVDDCGCLVHLLKVIGRELEARFRQDQHNIVEFSKASSGATHPMATLSQQPKLCG